MFVTVVISSKGPFSSGLTYEWAGNASDVSIGSLVNVPLRKSFVEGIVIEISNDRPLEAMDIKEMKEVLAKDFLSQVHIETAKWIAHEYFCTLRQSLGLFLPPLPWASALPKEEIWYRIASAENVKGAKQLSVISALQESELSESQLLKKANVSKTILKTMLEKKYIEQFVPEKKELKFQVPLMTIPTLSQEQLQVRSCLESKKAVLVFGATGSGKTEVYLYEAALMMKEGKSSVILAPEIFLTEHLRHRFEAVFPKEVLVILHSKLSKKESREVWSRVVSGKPCIVLGTRSALFAPVKNLGFIAIDEEHEWTYKNEQTPRYNAKSVAEFLQKQTGAALMLGTATPSMESWSKVKSEKYCMARIKSRYKDAAFPHVQIIDLGESNFGSLYPLTTPLINALKERLEKKEQSVLLLNHRGTASSMLCMECRRRLVSPVSNLPFTVHRASNGIPFLFDHASDIKAPVPLQCPFCKSQNLKEIGAGTQKLEDVLTKALPTARLLRADRDVLDTPEDMQKILSAMKNEEADILLGTQLVAKGLDLPKVTLAAVLVADVGLSLPHFRAGERIFQLLSQLAGRSGRHAPGDVIIQTFRPDAPEITFAASHDAEGYLEQETKLRKAYRYPPAIRMARVLFRGPSAGADAKKFLADVTQRAESLQKELLATSGPTFFSGGKVWQVLIRGENPSEILRGMNLKNISIDIDPAETL